MTPFEKYVIVGTMMDGREFLTSVNFVLGRGGGFEYSTDITKALRWDTFAEAEAVRKVLATAIENVIENRGHVKAKIAVAYIKPSPGFTVQVM